MTESGCEDDADWDEACGGDAAVRALRFVLVRTDVFQAPLAERLQGLLDHASSEPC